MATISLKKTQHNDHQHERYSAQQPSAECSQHINTHHSINTQLLDRMAQFSQLLSAVLPTVVAPGVSWEVYIFSKKILDILFG
jgi:hypothetical protein